MSIFKKTSAGLLAVIMAFSLCSCGKNATWAATINDYEVRAGIFINYQMNAYYEALDKVIELKPELSSSTETPDILGETIDDKNVTDWVNDEATKLMQEFVAIEQKFDELGLKFENNEEKLATNYINQLWSYYGEMYENIGISQQSEIDIYTNNYKKSAIFDYYYGKDGTNAISEDEIKQYIYDNYALVKYIEMPLKDGEGNLLKSDGKTEMINKANDYLSRAQNGESFDALIKEFNTYYDDMVAAANPSDENSSDGLSIQTDDDINETEAAAEEEVDNNVIINKDGSTPNQAVVDKLFDGSVKIGDYFIVELDEVYYVVSYLDILTQEGYLENADNSVRHLIKDEEFNSSISEWTTAQNVQRNDAAYKKYKLNKIVES